MTPTVLVTGGAGYIGSHTVVQLLASGRDVVVFDSLDNGHRMAVERAGQLAGKTATLVKGDVRDADALRRVFADRAIDAVMHFAGLKAVGEGQAEPLRYYDVNVNGSLVLLREMARAGVRTLVFSSSATVYGEPGCSRYDESLALAPVTVYGRSKRMVEDVLRDAAAADPRWKFAILRYFNPVGAHVSGQIGEDPLGTPNNLMPYIAQVAVGRRPRLQVFGGDYPTHDGTGERDYIHVDDLAGGHLAALAHLERGGASLTLNLGTGQPRSVLDVVYTFERVSGRPIPYEVTGRRPGDLASYHADPSLARSVLGWQARLDLERMCEDAWRWQMKNPDGYRATAPQRQAV